MSKVDLRKRRSAVLLLAGGASVRKTAVEVGVSESTVRAWRRKPEFAAAVAEVAALVRARERTGQELLEAVSGVVDRLGEGGQAGGAVTVSIPVGASPRRRRELLAKGIARALEGGA